MVSSPRDEAHRSHTQMFRQHVIYGEDGRELTVGMSVYGYGGRFWASGLVRNFILRVDAPAVSGIRDLLRNC